VSIRAVVAATDNMIDPKSMRTGDVLKTMSGLSVQVDDTDCEGRLTLADALHYVQVTGKATKVIDIATLTGAVEDALGPHVTGVWSNDERFMREFLQCSREAGESMHDMPLSEEYRDGNKGEMADLTNDGEGPGATIAALFLLEFVKSEVSWLHMDIGGTAFHRYDFGVNAIGATGVGVRTLGHFLLQYV
jgi:leucyl aminopeptidase